MTTAVSTTLLPATHVAVPATENYTIRNYSEQETSRFIYMSGDLYRGKVKVATLEDRGDGGEPWVHYNHDLDDDTFQAERARFEAWAEAIPGVDTSYQSATVNATNILLIEAGTFRELKRRRKLTIVDNVKGITSFDHRVFNTGVNIDTHRDALVQKFGADILFWDKSTQGWVKVAQ